MKLAAAAYPLDFLADWDAYAAKLTDWVARAARQEADLLVFPEYGAMELASLGGADVAADLEAALAEVMRHTSARIALHSQLAAEYGMHILAASGPAKERGLARPVNRAQLFGPDGLIGHQDKQIMTRFERETWEIAAHPGLVLFDLPFARVGVLICYDSEFPLLARALTQAGAELLLVPSCTDTKAGFHRVRTGAMARALEGQCVVLQAPTVGAAHWCPAIDENHGRAAIYGPPDTGFPADGVLSQTAPDMPGLAVAEIDRSAIARVRREGAVLNRAHWSEQARALHSSVRVVKPA